MAKDYTPLSPKEILEYEGAEFIALNPDTPPPGCFFSYGLTIAFKFRDNAYCEYIALNDSRSLFVKIHELLARLQWRDDATFNSWLAGREVAVFEIVQEPSAPNYLFMEWTFQGQDCRACYLPEAFVNDERNYR